MNIREFNYHQYLADLGHTNHVLCMSDPDHGPLFAKMDLEGDINDFYLYCLACDYRLHPGSEFSNVIRYKIKTIEERLQNAE